MMPNNVVVENLIIENKTAPKAFSLLNEWNEDQVKNFILFAIETIANIWISSIGVKETVNDTIDQIKNALDTSFDTSTIQEEILEYFYVEILEDVLINDLRDNIAEKLKQNFINKIEVDFVKMLTRFDTKVQDQKEKITKLSESLIETSNQITDFSPLADLPMSDKDISQDIRLKLINRLNWSVDEIATFQKYISEQEIIIEEDLDVDMLTKKSEMLKTCMGKKFVLNLGGSEPIISVTLPKDWELNKGLSNPDQSPYRIEDFVKFYLQDLPEEEFHILLFKSKEDIFKQYHPFYISNNYIITSNDPKLLNFAYHYAQVWYDSKFNGEDDEDEQIGFSSNDIVELIENSIDKWKGQAGYFQYFKKFKKLTQDLTGQSIQLQMEIMKIIFETREETNTIQMHINQSELEDIKETITSSLTEFQDKLADVN